MRCSTKVDLDHCSVHVAELGPDLRKAHQANVNIKPKLSTLWPHLFQLGKLEVELYVILEINGPHMCLTLIVHMGSPGESISAFSTSIFSPTSLVLISVQERHFDQCHHDPFSVTLAWH